MKEILCISVCQIRADFLVADHNIYWSTVCPTSTRCPSRTWHWMLPRATWDCEQRLSATGEKEGRRRGKPENTQDVVRKLALGTHSSPNSHPFSADIVSVPNVVINHVMMLIMTEHVLQRQKTSQRKTRWICLRRGRAQPCWTSTPLGCCMEPCDPEGGPGHYGPLWHDPCLGLLLKWSVAGKSDQWLMLKVIIVGWCWVNYIDLRTTPMIVALPRGQKMTSKVRKSLKGWEKDPKMVQILLDGDFWVSDIGDWDIWTRNDNMLLQSDSRHAALVSCTLLSGGICGHRKWEKVLDSLWDFKRLCQRFLQQQHKAMFDTNRLAGWLWICCGQRQKSQKSRPKKADPNAARLMICWQELAELPEEQKKTAATKAVGSPSFTVLFTHLYLHIFSCVSIIGFFAMASTWGRCCTSSGAAWRAAAAEAPADVSHGGLGPGLPTEMVRWGSHGFTLAKDQWCTILSGFSKSLDWVQSIAGRSPWSCLVAFILLNLAGFCCEQQEWLLDKIYNIVKKADDREPWPQLLVPSRDTWAVAYKSDHSLSAEVPRGCRGLFGSDHWQGRELGMSCGAGWLGSSPKTTTYHNSNCSWRDWMAWTFLGCPWLLLNSI